MIPAVKTHHPLSPSRLGRAMLCPGSVRMARLAPETESSEEAEMGTRLHAAMAGANVTLSEEEAELVTLCRLFAAEVTPGGAAVHHEQALSLLDSNAQVITEGTADYVAISPHNALVIDWKFGYQAIPEVSASAQVATYAAMVEQKFNLPTRAYLFQPRLNQRYHLVETPSVSTVISDVESIAANAEFGPVELSPSAEACLYCPALRFCPAPRLESLDLQAATDLSATPAGALGELGQMAKVVTRQSELVLEEIKTRLKRCEQIPGWRLQERKTYALVQDRGEP